MKRNTWYAVSLQKVYLIGPCNKDYDFALVFSMVSKKYTLTIQLASDKLYHNEIHIPLSNRDIVRLIFESEIQ